MIITKQFLTFNINKFSIIIGLDKISTKDYISTLIFDS